MDTSTTTERLDTSSASPQPHRAWPLIVAVAAGGLILALALALLGFRLARPGVLPGVSLDGVQVGDFSRDQLQATVDSLKQTREADTVTVRLGDTAQTSSNRDLGYRLEVEATVDTVWQRGRQSNPLAALADHLRSIAGPTEVSAVEEIDQPALERWANEVAETVGVAPIEGNVRFDGNRVSTRQPRPGARVRPQPLIVRGRRALERPGSETLEVETEPIAPATTPEDVERAAADAETVVSAPVTVWWGDAELTLEPEELARLFTVERRSNGSQVTLAITPDVDAADAVFTDEIVSAFNREPRDAEIMLTADGPRIEPSHEGFAFVADRARQQLLELALIPPGDGDTRSAELDGDVTDPELTTEDAEALEISEQVSSFTTNHQCCQSRVTNIHRIAGLVDGAVIRPGETFSLNGYVGPRTAEKGFVGGGAIFEGEYVEQIGGGVSQFATTFFNAAFFGGYEIVEHKPHSYYISRYPMGRESTVSYPNVDVKVRNNSPYGILVDTSYTDTSITVSFWGRNWVEVSSTTGAPTNYTSPPVRTRTNPDLPPGSSQVVQSGSKGFDVTVTRILTFPDGTVEHEQYFTRYLPEPRIIEQN